MYRNRARAAHVLQPSTTISALPDTGNSQPPPVVNRQAQQQLTSGDTASFASIPGGYTSAGMPPHSGGEANLYHTSAFQNGHTDPANKEVVNTDASSHQSRQQQQQLYQQSNQQQHFVDQQPLDENSQPTPTAIKDQNAWSGHHESWQNTALYGSSQNTGQGDQQQYQHPYFGDASHQETHNQEQASAQQAVYPELILDPSQQWYWDYNQQEWLPYYHASANENPVSAGEVEPGHAVTSDTSVQEVTNGVGELQLEKSSNVTNLANSYTQDGFHGANSSDIPQQKTRQDSGMSLSSYRSEPRGGVGPPVVLDDDDGPQGIDQRCTENTVPDEPDCQANHIPPPQLQEEILLKPPATGSNDHGVTMGPPDLVDHRPNASQPELVSDVSHPTYTGATANTAVTAVGTTEAAQSHSVPPPDMFASLPGSVQLQPTNATACPVDVTPPNISVPVPDVSSTALAPPPMQPLSLHHTPTLQSQSYLRQSLDLGTAPPMVQPNYEAASIGLVAANGSAPPQLGSDELTVQLGPRDDPLESGSSSVLASIDTRPSAPDLTAQSVIQNSGAHAGNYSMSESVSHDQHYDFYKGQIDSAMPDLTSGPSGMLPNNLRSTVPPQDNQGKAPDILRTEPLVPTSDRNLFMETGELREEDANRVSHQVAESLPSPNAPIQLPNKPTSGLPPMVGGNEPPSLVRHVVGESMSQGAPALNSAQRMVEGESTQASNILPPLPPREIEGEALHDPATLVNTRTIEGGDGSIVALPPPMARPRDMDGHTLPPLASSRSTNTTATAATVSVVPPGDLEFGSSVASTPITSSPTHLNSQTEVRSEAAGSERRDETVMGGPPAAKAPPRPTPGRAVAGQESSSPYGARRRGDQHKKSTYDSDEERNQDSESERERERRRLQPRRPISPGARSVRSRPGGRGYERTNRSSTERDEDSERRNRNYSRDQRANDSYYRRDRDRYRDQHRRYREDDDDLFRDDDRRSVHGGGRRIKEEPYRYRDDHYYRRNRIDSDYERESHYGDELLNRSSRPASRAGSVSHYDPNESLYSRGASGNLAFFQQQLLQHQLAMMNPLQYQLQTAVREMEKALESPENVHIYQQHWETYEKQPQLLDKLRIENPVMHHLLNHFRQNFWHLVDEKKPVIKREKMEDPPPPTAQDLTTHNEMEQFAMNLHPPVSHRPESRQTGYKSTQGSWAEVPEKESWREDNSALPERLTPLMFSRPHVCARMSASGVLVNVEAAAPHEGQTASVELHSVSALLSHTRDYHQLASFPGPLKPGETHKNDVIKFCERKIADGRERRMMDRESYELLWCMMILLLRQKGQVEGSDLADLLLRDRNRMDASSEHQEDRSRGSSIKGSVTAQDQEESSSSYSEDQVERIEHSRTQINMASSQEEIVAKFRVYLLHGNKQEALEYAMRVGLWGHALFLASKMDQRAYAGVMTRFANGLAINDPLQTLYQLMSARMPSAMKHCADQRWGDWRPHLAMILSNPLPGSDINRRSMVTLGDTLMGKGQLYAAQFCYIVSAVEFGTYAKKSSKLVLLGSTVGEKSVEAFATNEAIQCTEIYEFVQKLGNQQFEMPTLQPFKFVHAVRLCEVGLVARAQDYCRQIAQFVVRCPSRVETDFMPDFLQQLAYLSDRLKYQDPQYTTSSGELSEIADPEWLTKLVEMVNNMTYGQPVDTIHSVDGLAAYEYDNYETSPGWRDGVQPDGEQPTSPVPEAAAQAPQSETLHTQYQESETQLTHQMEEEEGVVGQEVTDGGHTEQETANNPGSAGAIVPTHQGMYNPADYGAEILAPSAGTTVPPMTPSMPPTGVGSSPTTHRPSGLQLGSLEGLSSELTNQLDVTGIPPGNTQPPPPLTSGATATAPPPPVAASDPTVDYQRSSTLNSKSVKEGREKETAEKKNESKTGKSGWFGGIFGKILKPSNQIHLPDDSNKSIVYDDKLGRWVNLDGSDDSMAPVGPPPMDPVFMGGSVSKPDTVPNGMPLPPNNNSPAAPTLMATTNLTQSFRAPKRKGRGYVDVLVKSGATKPVTTPPMLLSPVGGGEAGSGSAAVATLPPMMLCPSPSVTGESASSFDNPSRAPVTHQQQVPSPNPSDLSASRAVSDDGGSNPSANSMPMMFDPSSMAGVTHPPAI